MALTRFKERMRYSQLLRYFIIRFMHQWVDLELSGELGRNNSLAANRGRSETLGIKTHLQQIHAGSCSVTLFIAGYAADIQVHFIGIFKLRRTLWLYSHRLLLNTVCYYSILCIFTVVWRRIHGRLLFCMLGKAQLASNLGKQVLDIAQLMANS